MSSSEQLLIHRAWRAARSSSRSCGPTYGAHARERGWRLPWSRGEQTCAKVSPVGGRWQRPQKTEIPPAVFTRFFTYRVNAEWLPVLRARVPLTVISPRPPALFPLSSRRSLSLGRASASLHARRTRPSLSLAPRALSSVAAAFLSPLPTHGRPL